MLIIFYNYGKTLDYFMSKLSSDLGNKIYSFLIPESKNIKFCKYSINKHSNSSYNPKYEKAYINNLLVINTSGLYLSRISKKNKKHRYYITEEIIDIIDVEHHDSIYKINHYDYLSTYVGKNIDKALLILFY